MMTTKHDNEMLVWMRNEMVANLYEAIDDMRKGNGRVKLAKVLTRIANTERYTINTKCQEDFYQSGRKYSMGHVKILEADEGFTIKIYALDGELRLTYDRNMLLTYEERKAQYEEEIEAERIMNEWANGHR